MNPTAPTPTLRPLTIGELTRVVKGLLETAFPESIWLVGEVSNLKKHTSGHWYLTLKDSESQLQTVIYRGVNARLRFDVQNGMELLVRGRLTLYVPRGEYQFQVEEVQPKGMGALELAFQQLREKLFRLGYFDPARKKRIPRFPRRIILITSPTGAAVRDMLEVLARRWPATEVWVYPVAVQGEGAAEQIAAAVEKANRLPGVEVIVVARGGGSLEDLWEFNEECVARAVFESRRPVVSGVGHETDLTITDLVADVRALTPSEAAERVVPNRLEMLQELKNFDDRMRVLLQRRIDLLRKHLRDLESRRCFRSPLDGIRDHAQMVDERATRLDRAAKLRLAALTARMEAVAGKLQSLSPLNVLARGYSLTRTEADRRVVREAGQVGAGDRVETLLASGRIVSRVEEVIPDASVRDHQG